MQSENLVPCGYHSCRCLVEMEDVYCSEACAKSKGHLGVPCFCGHPECAENRRTRADELLAHDHAVPSDGNNHPTRFAVLTRLLHLTRVRLRGSTIWKRALLAER